MKKLKIALIIIALVVVAFSVVAYILWKEQTIEFFDKVIDFINRPLPIFGVSTVIAAGFIYKCFVSTKYGRKTLSELKQEKENMFSELELYKDKLYEKEEMIKALVNAHQHELDVFKKYLTGLYENSNNIKVKELGEKFINEINELETTIVDDLGKYKDDYLVAKANNFDNELIALKEQFEAEINKLKEEINNGKED